ncbi:MAG: hypothetical protein IJI26_13165 [Clostridia bacterium]|nr:hypothetical protein [Clostridia bacterium]
MKLLNSTNDIDNLIKDVDRCRGDVIMRSCDGSEEFNLKSALSRYVAIGTLCQEHGDEYEFFCMDRHDEPIMLDFFRQLRCA